MKENEIYENGISEISKNNSKLCPFRKKSVVNTSYISNGRPTETISESFQECVKDYCMLYSNGRCMIGHKK